MCDNFGMWEWLLVVLFVACLCHLRLSRWLGLVALCLPGFLVSAFLQGLAHFSPEGDIDPYMTGGFRLMLLQAGWAIRGASWLGVVVGLTAALLHIRRKMDALQRAAIPSRIPEPDALRPWNEKTQPPSRDIRP